MLCVYSIAYAEIVKEVRVEVKVEKKNPLCTQTGLIQTIYKVFLTIFILAKKGSCANLKSSHFGRMVFNKLEDHVDCQMVRGEY